MRKEIIEQLVRSDQLRHRSPDKERIKSMIESSMMTMPVVETISITAQSATLIFRETYESIRQLGDAKWWLLGYEPRNHEVSIEVLKEMDISQKVKLGHLARFKGIRHDANYRGFKITESQAKEIVEFWASCSKEIISLLQREL